MKKAIISLFLAITLVSATFVAVFAAYDYGPHAAPPDTCVILTHDTGGH